MRSALAGILVGLMVGCQAGPAPTFDGPVYPASSQKLETLDVQAVLGETDITLTNGTARRLGPVTVWLNRWFAADVDVFAPGDRIVLPLSKFRNESGLAPRGGGFFATRDRDEIVSVELLTAEGLHGVRLLGARR